MTLIILIWCYFRYINIFNVTAKGDIILKTIPKNHAHPRAKKKGGN
jgi:hypothetical protein